MEDMAICGNNGVARAYADAKSSANLFRLLMRIMKEIELQEKSD